MQGSYPSCVAIRRAHDLTDLYHDNKMPRSVDWSEYRSDGTINGCTHLLRIAIPYPWKVSDIMWLERCRTPLPIRKSFASAAGWTKGRDDCAARSLLGILAYAVPCRKSCRRQTKSFSNHDARLAEQEGKRSMRNRQRRSIRELEEGFAYAIISNAAASHNASHQKAWYGLKRVANIKSNLGHNLCGTICLHITTEAKYDAEWK